MFRGRRIHTERGELFRFVTTSSHITNSAGVQPWPCSATRHAPYDHSPFNSRQNAAQPVRHSIKIPPVLIVMCFKLVWQLIWPSQRPPLSDGVKNPADRTASAIFTIFFIIFSKLLSGNPQTLSSSRSHPSLFASLPLKELVPIETNSFLLLPGSVWHLEEHWCSVAVESNPRAVFLTEPVGTEPTYLHSSTLRPHNDWGWRGRGHNQGCWTRMKLLRSRDQAAFSCSLWQLDCRQTLWGFLGNETHDPKCKLYL